MTKQDLVREVAKAAGLTLSTAEDAVNAMVKTIVRAVKAGGRFELRDLGTFTKVRREARTAINRFGGGGPIKIPAHNVVKFKPAPFFKDAVK